MKSDTVFDRGVVTGVLPLLAAGMVWLAGCERAPNRNPDGKPVAFASVAPIAGIARRVAGDRAHIEVLAGPEQDPHGFSPTPRQLVALGDASVFFTIGMPFETRLVEKLKSGTKGLRIVKLTDGLELLELDESHDHHDHEEEGHDHKEHGHDEKTPGGPVSDPHVWLSPHLLKQEAAHIARTLEEIDPVGSATYQDNLATLVTELDALDAELKAALAPFKGQSFYVFHGAFGYFAQTYGLKQEAIETGGRSPEPKRIFQLIEQAKAEGVKLILVQPQFDTKSAEAIAEGIGGIVVPVNPMGDDVFATLRTLAEQVKASR